MRSSYLVTYDISDAKRLRLVFRTTRGYGDHLQYSVFECQLTASDLVPFNRRFRGAVRDKHRDGHSIQLRAGGAALSH